MRYLKKVRANLKLTQKQMAKMLNTPLRTYIKWENGERRTPGIVFAMIFIIEKDEDAKNALFAKYT